MPHLLVLRSLTPPEIAPVQRAFQSTGIFHALDAVSFVKNAFGVLAKGLEEDPALNFGTFLRDLLSAVPNALLNRGALAVRENQAATGPRYPTQKAFGQETQWLLWRLRGASARSVAPLAQDAP